MKWKYGNAWEQFPIGEKQVWGLDDGSRIAVHNIFEPLPRFMFNADVLLVDPPWNLGNINSFYTKAGRDDYLEKFSDFEEALFGHIGEIRPNVCYLEVGRQSVDKWYNRLSIMYDCIQAWDTTYYHKRDNKCFVIRGGWNESRLDLSGMDEEDAIYLIGEKEEYHTMGDLCMGLGLVGLSAHRAGKPFVGTELNKRRLANLLQELHKKGAEVKRYE